MVTTIHNNVDENYINFWNRCGIFRAVKLTCADEWFSDDMKKHYDMAVITNVDFNGNQHIKPLNKW